MKRILMIGAFLIFGLVSGAMAQDSGSTRTPKASARQVKQNARIAQGVKSGELTRRETKALRSQQCSINRTKKRAKADGQVTKAERARIQGKQNRANRSIRRQKNDGQSRGN
ncbi:MAG: hypothetical protein AAFX87_24715 [Bacteroidota bacterium]